MGRFTQGYWTRDWLTGTDELRFINKHNRFVHRPKDARVWKTARGAGNWPAIEHNQHPTHGFQLPEVPMQVIDLDAPAPYVPSPEVEAALQARRDAEVLHCVQWTIDQIESLQERVQRLEDDSHTHGCGCC